MPTPWTWRHKAPPPTLQIFFQNEQVAELTKQELATGEVYTFRYLPGFGRLNLAPLPGFPDLTKIYQSADLWQYFLERIPDVRRPEIQALIRARRISQHDELKMLVEFGAHSVSDPFEIRAA